MFMLIMLQNAEKHHSDPNAVGLPLANWGRAEPLLPASDTLAITALANGASACSKHVGVKRCSVAL